MYHETSYWTRAIAAWATGTVQLRLRKGRMREREDGLGRRKPSVDCTKITSL